MTTYSFLWFTLKRDEKTWKVWTAQDPSKSVTSWLIWQRHASSASSHTVGWKAAKMAEKNGEGGGGKPRSSKSSTSSRKLLPWKWERNRGTEKKRIDTFPEKKKRFYVKIKYPAIWWDYMSCVECGKMKYLHHCEWQLIIHDLICPNTAHTNIMAVTDSNKFFDCSLTKV